MSSTAEKTYGVLKAVFAYQETMKALREDMSALSADVTSLSRAHASLSERVARLEGFIQGATRTPFRPDEPRLIEE